jgi:hypothetical protein
MIEKEYIIITQNIPIRTINGKGSAVEYLRYDFIVDKDHIYHSKSYSSAINYMEIKYV